MPTVTSAYSAYSKSKPPAAKKSSSLIYSSDPFVPDYTSPQYDSSQYYAPPTAPSGSSGLLPTRAATVRKSTPGSFVTGYKTTEYGKDEYDAALVDWNKVYSDAQQGIPAALELIEQFAPGGGYGAGRRAEAKELVQKGLAKDTATAVALGGSSMFASRGLNVLANRELTKQYADIEDERARLQVAAFSPYTQMLSNLAQIGTARPAYKSYVSQVQTPQYARY